MKSKLTFRPFSDVGDILQAMEGFDRNSSISYSLKMHYRDGKWTYRKIRR